MSWNNEIAENIKKLAGTVHLKDKPDLYYATVNTDDPYNVAARTCNVTLISGRSGINITSASLMPEVNDGILILPSPGSTVVIAKVANGNPFVLMFSQIDKVLIIAGDTELSLDGTTSPGTTTISQGDMNIVLSDGKISINQTGGQNFTTIMQNILTHMQNVVTHISALTVSTGTGPSGIPINLSDFSNDLSDLTTDANNLTQILN